MSESVENNNTTSMIKTYLNEIQLKYSFLNMKNMNDLDDDPYNEDQQFHMLNGHNFDLITQIKPNELVLNMNGLKIETQESTYIPLNDFLDDFSGLSTRSNEFFTHQIELIPDSTLPILDDSILACLDDSKAINNQRKQSCDLSICDDSDVTTSSSHKQSEDHTHLKYTLKFIKRIFTYDEIKTGIFGDKNNNSKSKTQIPFSSDKVNLVKRALKDRFSFNDDQLERIWLRLRPKLNKKLADMRRNARTHRIKSN